MNLFDAIHPLDDFWYDGEPPNKIDNIIRQTSKKTPSFDNDELERIWRINVDDIITKLPDDL